MPSTSTWGTTSTSSTTEASSSSLPLFHNDALQNLSWGKVKASMEAQMPTTILGMGYQQRFQVFCGLLFLSAIFFALASFVGLPTLAVRPQKFALSFTLGSLTFLAAFAILQGPQAQLQSFRARKVFSVVYFSSLFVTLGTTFSVSGWTGYAVVILSSAVQILALVYYLVSFLPGGAAGLKYLTSALMQLLQPIVVHCTRLQAMVLQRLVSWVGATRRSESDAD